MCDVVALPGGGHAFVCGRRHSSGRRKPCSKCGRAGATLLCDGQRERIVVEGGAEGRHPYVCSKALCRDCAHVRGTGDYCDDCVDNRPRLAL